MRLLHNRLSRFAVISCVFTISMAGSDPSLQEDTKATEYVVKADRFFAEHALDSAKAYYEMAATLFEQHREREKLLEVTTKVGRVLVEQRKIAEAISFLKSKIAVAESVTPLQELVENFYSTLSEAYYHAGDALGSLTYHKKVFAINTERGNTPIDKMINLTRIIGVLYYNSGQLQDGIEYYTRYMNLIKETYGEKHLSMSDAYNYIGMVYRYMGEYEMSLDYYNKALINAEHYTREERQAISPRFASIAPLYNNIGNIYHDLKDHEKALEYTLKAMALRIAEKEENHPGMASIYGGLGTTYGELRQYDKALEFKEKSLAIYKRSYGEKHGVIATALKSIGDTYFAKGDFTTAEKLYRQALVMNLDVHDAFHPNTGDAYAKLSNVHVEKNDLYSALLYSEKSISSLVKDFTPANYYDNPDIHALCYARLQLLQHITTKADLLHRLYSTKSHRVRDLEAAQQTYAIAVDLSEIIRKDMIDNTSKMYLSENIKSLYEKNIRVALELYNLTQDDIHITSAFEVMEKNKSRLLLESIQDSQLKRNFNVPDSLFDKENGLKNRITFIEKQILDERVKGSGKDSVKLHEWESELFSVERSLESLVNYFKRAYPNYHYAKYELPEVTPEILKKSSRESDMVLEFFSGDSAVYLFFANSKIHQVVQLDTSVNRHALAMLRGLQELDYHLYATHAHALYNMLLKPAVEALPESFKITVIPDGILSVIPFELLLKSLPVQQGTGYRDLEYVIKNHSITYAYSATLMLNDFQRTSGKSEHALVAFAPKFDGAIAQAREIPGDIPYAQQEVENILQQFPGKMYLGTEATEYNFKNLTNTYSIVHMATHAIIDEKDPNLSRLYLASSDSTEDGLLYAYELFDLEMSADLITLSACNTAVGQWKEGEGAMSLSRAFAYAGCPSTVTSLWPAQDQTTGELMNYFYQNLAEGMRKDEALRNAKLKFLEQADKVKGNPFYWGGFILIGNTEPVTKNNTFWWLVLGGIVVITITGIWYGVRQLIVRKEALSKVNATIQH